MNNRKAPHLRRQVLKNKIASSVLRAIETKLNTKIQFETHLATSEWDPNTNAIRLERRPQSKLKKLLIGHNWPNRILFHELGHAFLSVFYKYFDQKAFRKIFGKYNGYSASTIDIIIGNLSGRKAVTRYGCAHAQESFAESFSFVACENNEASFDAEVVLQLSYVDWAIICSKSKKVRWGPFKEYCVDVLCDQCTEVFILAGCRSNLDIRAWEIICPYCKQSLVGI